MVSQAFDRLNGKSTWRSMYIRLHNHRSALRTTVLAPQIIPEHENHRLPVLGIFRTRHPHPDRRGTQCLGETRCMGVLFRFAGTSVNRPYHSSRPPKVLRSQQLGTLLCPQVRSACDAKDLAEGQLPECGAQGSVLRKYHRGDKHGEHLRRLLGTLLYHEFTCGAWCGTCRRGCAQRNRCAHQCNQSWSN